MASEGGSSGERDDCGGYKSVDPIVDAHFRITVLSEKHKMSFIPRVSCGLWNGLLNSASEVLTNKTGSSPALHISPRSNELDALRIIIADGKGPIHDHCVEWLRLKSRSISQDNGGSGGCLGPLLDYNDVCLMNDALYTRKTAETKRRQTQSSSPTAANVMEII